MEMQVAGARLVQPHRGWPAGVRHLLVGLWRGSRECRRPEESAATSDLRRSRRRQCALGQIHRARVAGRRLQRHVHQHGYTSHTPVSDGERVYVFFGKTGVLAFDLDGNKLWQTGVGTGSGAHDWGTASSPIVYKDLVIVMASAESKSLVALNKETGKEVWRREDPGFSGTWGTPTSWIAERDGRTL